MKYTINQMAKLLATTTHKLRYYQKIGIIKPQIEASTGYRFYSVLDTRRFNLACIYCKLGFSIQESLKLLSIKTKDEVIEDLIEQKSKIKKELLFKELCLEHIEDMERYLHNINNSLNNVIIIERDEMIRVEFSKEEIINKDKKILKFRDLLVEYSPLIEWASRIPNDVVYENSPLTYYYGINIKSSYVKKLGLEIENYTVLPAGKYLCTTFIKSNRKPFEIETLDSIKKYIDEKNLNIDSDAFSSCFHSTIVENDYNNYHFIIMKL